MRQMELDLGVAPEPAPEIVVDPQFKDLRPIIWLPGPEVQQTVEVSYVIYDAICDFGIDVLPYTWLLHFQSGCTSVIGVEDTSTLELEGLGFAQIRKHWYEPDQKIQIIKWVGSMRARKLIYEIYKSMGIDGGCKYIEYPELKEDVDLYGTAERTVIIRERLVYPASEEKANG